MTRHAAVARAARWAALPVLLGGCATSAQRSAPPLAPAAAPTEAVVAKPVPAPAPPPATLPPPKRPVAPPTTAFMLGLMPVRGTGVAAWRADHPTYDGRGVLIGILDSGVDPGVAGLQTTSTGLPKLLDLRNFSSEGPIALEPVRADRAGRIALAGGLVLSGAAAVAAVAQDSVWYGGVIHELSFGDAPAADFNGNGSNRDSYGVVVVRGRAGWVAFIDADGDGTLDDDKPVADFLAQRQTFTFGEPAGSRPAPITAAVNLSADASGKPRLSLVLDTAGHGTHVAGIAAGHAIGGVEGFDGIAPGAQIIALKIADDARGGISTTGAMVEAMDYAARFAAERHLPLVLNMSFGIGNMEPGAAVMDSVVDAFLVAHPGVVFAIAAGNDGPGTRTMGLPASAALALAVGAVYPAEFSPVQFGTQSPDVLGWWSSRGGALDKPDVVTPGMAYSTVPEWNTGSEVKVGTSMASPYAAGLVADLLSAALADGRTPTAAQLVQALKMTAHHLRGESETDEGAGMPQLEAAWQWLRAKHAAARYLVRALPPADSGPAGSSRSAPRDAARPAAGGPSAAYRRAGLAGPWDTVQTFVVRRVADSSSGPAGQEARSFRLRSDVPWLAPVRPTVVLDPAGADTLVVRYDAARLSRPGRYVGAVDACAAADTAAGAAFRLVSEVIVPDRASWGTTTLADRRLAAGEAWRYYVNVPAGAADLSVRVVAPDTSYRGALSLFEPSGRPSRTDDESDFGGRMGASGELSVTANDLTPGVWEAVVQAMPGDALRYGFSATVPAIAISHVDSAGLSPAVTLQSALPRDTTLRVTAAATGIATEWRATVEHGGPYRRTFDAPAWATQAILEVQLAPGFWNTVTDFGLTFFDKDGAQLGNSPMNYDFNRLVVDLPAKRGGRFPVTAELFPAFALPVPPASFTAHVRVAFVGPGHAIPLGEHGDTATVSLTGYGTAAVRIPGFDHRAPGAGWADLVRLRVMGRADDWAYIERTIPILRP